jgi:hypothetical protein
VLIKNRMPGFRHFAFTFFNYQESHVVTLRQLCDTSDLVRYIAWGYEICPSTQRPHLQGAIGFNRQVSILRVKAVLGSQSVHVEGARDILRNYGYAIKVAADGGRIEEYGDRPANAQGERKDVDVAVQAIKDGMKLKQFRSEFFGMYRGSPSAWVELIADYTPPPEIQSHPLSAWQQLLHNELAREVDKRKIFFLVDAIGNSGKSWFVKYYHQLHGDKSILLQPGKRNDMGYIFYKASLDASRRVVFIDCKRSEAELLDYRFLESLKDGWMQNGKYNSTTFYFKVPHVVVMMNEMPDVTKLSTDRYHIHSIDRRDTHHD